MDAEEHDRLSERASILAAMLAATERLHELIDVVQARTAHDPTLPETVAALLGCDAAAARTVLAMPLDAASPDRQRRLRSELDELRQLLA